MGNKHVDNTYKCCTSDADGIFRQWALPDNQKTVTVIIINLNDVDYISME
jgi:hypothetical protein